MQSKRQHRALDGEPMVGSDILPVQRAAQGLAFLALALLAASAFVESFGFDVGLIRPLRTVALAVLLAAPWLWVVSLFVRSIRRRRIRTSLASALVMLFAVLALVLSG